MHKIIQDKQDPVGKCDLSDFDYRMVGLSISETVCLLGFHARSLEFPHNEPKNEKHPVSFFFLPRNCWFPGTFRHRRLLRSLNRTKKKPHPDQVMFSSSAVQVNWSSWSVPAWCYALHRALLRLPVNNDSMHIYSCSSSRKISIGIIIVLKIHWLENNIYSVF